MERPTDLQLLLEPLCGSRKATKIEYKDLISNLVGFTATKATIQLRRKQMMRRSYLSAQPYHATTDQRYIILFSFITMSWRQCFSRVTFLDSTILTNFDTTTFFGTLLFLFTSDQQNFSYTSPYRIKMTTRRHKLTISTFDIICLVFRKLNQVTINISWLQVLKYYLPVYLFGVSTGYRWGVIHAELTFTTN